MERVRGECEDEGTQISSIALPSVYDEKALSRDNRNVLKAHVILRK